MTHSIKLFFFYFFTIMLSSIMGCLCKDDIISPEIPEDPKDAIKLYSSDGGVTWESHMLLDPDALYSITSTAEGVFLASGIRDNDIIVARSTNFGDNWSSNSNITNGLENCRSVVFGNDLNSAVLIVDKSLPNHNNTQQYTTDNGINWNNTGNIGGLNSVSFYDGLNGVAVGNLGIIVKTSDGGRTWYSISSPTSTDLHDISFYGQSAFAVGMLGRVIKTTDGGNTWAELSSPTQNTLSAVVYFSPDDAVAAGSSGAIIKTSDGGTTWQQIEGGGHNFLNDIAYDFISGTLIICGSGGTVLRSTNNGLSFAAQTSGTNRNLYGIYFVGECYIVGD